MQNFLGGGVDFPLNLSLRGKDYSDTDFFALTQRPNLPLPLGEVSRSDGEGWKRNKSVLEEI